MSIHCKDATSLLRLEFLPTYALDELTDGYFDILTWPEESDRFVFVKPIGVITMFIVRHYLQ